MTSDQRRALLDTMKASIDRHGYHLRIVAGGPLPTFAYTIGMRSAIGRELVLAGGAAYRSIDEIKTIVAAFVGNMEQGPSEGCRIEGLGEFALQEAEPSWTGRMLLGVLDYYQIASTDALQIVPDDAGRTIDVPRMQEPWDRETQPVWRWLEDPWTYPISPQSRAVTHLAALQGLAVTEATRWEEDEWELFAGSGPDVDQATIRVAPMGTMLAHHPTLERVIDLKIGSGMWRDQAGGTWHAWSKKEE